MSQFKIVRIKNRKDHHFAEFRKIYTESFPLNEQRTFIQSKITPLILGIEPPVDDLTSRRLRFYESLGFVTNKHPHFQPPYHPGDQFLQLNILTYPNQISEEQYAQFSQFQKNTVMG